MDRSIEEIEDLRLKELRKQAAMFGPQTDPAVLIEIQELNNRQRTIARKQYINQLDYDFIMNVVAAALVRLGAVEGNQQKDKSSRYWRQLIHDVWMVAITVGVVVILVLELSH